MPTARSTHCRVLLPLPTVPQQAHCVACLLSRSPARAPRALQRSPVATPDASTRPLPLIVTPNGQNGDDVDDDDDDDDDNDNDGRT